MVIKLLIKTQHFITCWTLEAIGWGWKMCDIFGWHLGGVYCSGCVFISWLSGEGVLHRCSVKSKDTEAFCIPMWGWQAVCEVGIE